MLNQIRKRTGRGFIFAIIVSFLSLTSLSTQAGVISAGEAIQAEAKIQQLNNVEDFLARADVQSNLESLGVDPAMARARVASLSAEELAQLSGEIDKIPAGGDALVIAGIVILVLILLELVGITNFTSKF
jgi:hypothetical protein